MVYILFSTSQSYSVCSRLVYELKTGVLPDLPAFYFTVPLAQIVDVCSTGVSQPSGAGSFHLRHSALCVRVRF